MTDTTTRIWHDDIRRAPEGWIWSRTNQHAIWHLAGAAVSGIPVAEISLDHDLGLHELDPADYEKPEILRGSSEETGLQLVQAMCLLRLVPAIVTIHSWNPEGARNMAHVLNDYGHDCLIRPYETSAAQTTARNHKTVDSPEQQEGQ